MSPSEWPTSADPITATATAAFIASKPPDMITNGKATRSASAPHAPRTALTDTASTRVEEEAMSVLATAQMAAEPIPASTPGFNGQRRAARGWAWRLSLSTWGCTPARARAG